MFNDDNLNGESSNVIDTNLKNLNFAYKKMLPHYNISSVDVNKGAYHSFLTGSLLNIVCDTRSFLSKLSGSILGNDQINFIKNESLIRIRMSNHISFTFSHILFGIIGSVYY